MSETEKKLTEKEMKEIKDKINKEFAEKKEKMRKFVEKEFKGFDYALVVSLAKSSKGLTGSFGFHATSIGGNTPFQTVKHLFSNAIAKFNDLMNIYNIQPAPHIQKEEPKEEFELTSVH